MGNGLRGDLDVTTKLSIFLSVAPFGSAYSGTCYLLHGYDAVSFACTISPLCYESSCNYDAMHTNPHTFIDDGMDFIMPIHKVGLANIYYPHADRQARRLGLVLAYYPASTRCQVMSLSR
jgi:hypothetical protein